MDRFKRIDGNRWECQRCGFKIMGEESPYRCVKCRTLDAFNMDKDYFASHSDEALNDSSKK